MKKLIIAWTIFGLICEFGILYTLDKFILIDSYDFQVTEVKEAPKEVADINTVVKESAENISLSYSGKYIAYRDGNSLCIEDTKNGAINKVPSQNKIMYYKWLGNRNIIAFVEMNEITTNAPNFQSKEGKKITKITIVCKHGNLTAKLTVDGPQNPSAFEAETK